MHWTNIGLILVAGLDLGMALLIWLRNPKDKINITFSLAFFSFGVWSFFVFLFRSTLFSADVALLDLIFRTKIFIGLLIAFFLYVFSIYFPAQRKPFSVFQLVALLIPVVFLVLLTFLPTGYVGSPRVFPNGNIYLANTYFWSLFAAVFSFYLMGCVVRLFLKRKSSVGLERTQLNFVLGAIMIGSFAGLAFNIFLPFYDHFRLEWIGPFYSFPILFILSYFLIRMER